MKKLENKPDDFLKQFARDYHAGHIFTSDRLKEQQSLYATVFMPLLFMDQETAESVKDAQLIYEYYDKAGPRSVNGFPMFLSCGFLTGDDVAKVQKYVNQIEAAIKGVLDKNE